MLYLSKNNLKELLNYDQMIESIERAYRIQAKGSFIMPDRMHLHYDDNTLLFMPCVIDSSYCTKLVTVFPKNKSLDKPVVDGIVVLNDNKTGQVKALIDGQLLTAIRTGAVGGTAVKHLSHDGVKTLGIIGCGVQGYYQSLFADHVRNFDKIYIYDAYGYHEGFEETFSDKLVVAESANHLVCQSDVIITATTSYEPIFTSKDVKDKLFIGIGSFKPDMREYSDDFIKSMDHILVDTPFAKLETGDLKIPIDRGIIDQDQVRIFESGLEGSIFFKSVGMALFDNVVAESIYLSAIEEDKGQVLED